MQEELGNTVKGTALGHRLEVPGGGSSDSRGGYFHRRRPDRRIDAHRHSASGAVVRFHGEPGHTSQ